jgi:hypothetical protein
MSYIITTLCLGQKYEPIRNHWTNRITDKCKSCQVKIFNDFNILHPSSFTQGYPGYIWAVRFKHNLDLLMKTNVPIVMCDLDVIIEKDIQPIVDLSFDIIISKEIGGSSAYPKECSQKLGFGVCCGFMIVKPTARKFMVEIFKNMSLKKYNTYDDQVNIMNYIVNNKHKIKEETCLLNGVEFTNKIIEIDNIKICILDFEIITRDPIVIKHQFGNHINIDNVGGVQTFIKYFYEPLENLPLTCRCGKSHLGDNNICKHIDMRKQ